MRSTIATRAFIDTNILLYAIEDQSLEKTQSAISLLDTLRVEGRGVISSQVVQEFAFNAIRKFGATPAEASRLCVGFQEFLFVAPTFQTTIDALRIMERWQLSFWDSLLFAAAKDAGCEILYTEDLSHGQVIEGIQIINPFLP